MSHNNPFALDPQQRYPDINGGQPQPQQQQQPLQPYQTGYLQPQAQQQFGYGQASPQPQPGYSSPMGAQSPMYAQPTGGYGHTQSTGFQPSSQFGQYLKTQGTGLNFGAPPSAASYASQPGASAFMAPTPSPQPQQQPPSYLNPVVADLDPFSAQQRQQMQQSQMQGGSYQQHYQTTPQQQETRQQEQFGEHPRNYMRSNKQSLETWNMDAWGRVKGLLNQLERAWEGRKKMVMEWQTWPLAMDDRDTCDKLRKEADENIDTVAAYTLQVKEIVESYRYSSDQSSRAMTRRALNEGLQSLPDWPLTLQAPPKLADSSNRPTPLLDPSPAPSQQQMNGYYQQQQAPPPQMPQMYPQQQQPQPTGYGGMQMQPSYTGYPQQQPLQQQQPQMTGMYGQPGMQMGMPPQQTGYRQW